MGSVETRSFEDWAPEEFFGPQAKTSNWGKACLLPPQSKKIKK